MRQRILITGASGFVGYHLILEALRNNFEVFAAIRKSSDIKHLEGMPINFVYPDFDNAITLRDNISNNKYAYIIHAAGLTKARSIAEYEHINASYTYNLATASADAGNIKKFVLISSLAALGPLDNLSGLIDESTVPRPLTSYGRSKLNAEVKLRSVQNLNYTILRPTGVYGPRDRDFFLMFKQISLGLELYIGRLEQKLSLLYVTDLAKAASSALHAPAGSTYNLSDGNYYSRYQLSDITKQILSKKTLKLHLPVKFVKLMANVAETYSALSKKAAVLNTEKVSELSAVNWNCSIQLAKEEINFKPATTWNRGSPKPLSGTLITNGFKKK